MTLTLAPQQAQLLAELMNLGVKSIGLSMSPDAYRAATPDAEQTRRNPEASTMSTFTKTLTAVNDKALAFAAAKYNAGSGSAPVTDLEYLDIFLSGELKSWQDQYIKIPASEFLLRFPAGKVDAIKALAEAGNTQLQAYVNDLKVAPFVYTGSTLVRGGIASLVKSGLLTQAQADVILA